MTRALHALRALWGRLPRIVRALARIAFAAAAVGSVTYFGVEMYQRANPSLGDIAQAVEHLLILGWLFWLTWNRATIADLTDQAVDDAFMARGEVAKVRDWIAENFGPPRPPADVDPRADTPPMGIPAHPTTTPTARVVEGWIEQLLHAPPEDPSVDERLARFRYQNGYHHGDAP